MGGGYSKSKPSKSMPSMMSKPNDLQEKMVQKAIAKLKKLHGLEEESKGSFADLHLMDKYLPSKLKSLKSESESVDTSNSTNEAVILQNAKILVNAQSLQGLYFPSKDVPKDGYRVKLIVTALSLKTEDSNLKSTAVKIFHIAKLGTVHTALQVGDQIVEWNNSGLVFPIPSQQFFNRKTLFAIDLEFIEEKERFSEKIVPGVCEVIARWNGTRDYSEISSNCQQFTEDVLKEIGINTNWSGQVKQFLDNLNSIDKNDLVFNVAFSDGNKLEIRNHAELDEECFKKWGSPHQAPKNSEEYKLLKAYDRVFWLRYYGVKNSKNLEDSEKYTLLDKYRCFSDDNNNTQCFFEDPEYSGTMWGGKDTPSF